MTKNKNKNIENENEEIEQLFEFEENIEGGEEVVSEKEDIITPITTEPIHTTISTNTYPQITSQKLNTTSSKTYKVILVKENSFILDVNGNGAGPYPKTTSTQNIKIGDEITLQNEE